MMKVFTFGFFMLVFLSCSSSKSTTNKTSSVANNPTSNSGKENKIMNSDKNVNYNSFEGRKEINSTSDKNKVDNVIDFAKTFEGTRYKFSGTTKSGMDCSGLVYTAFQKEDVVLPRISRDMATKGLPISLSDVTQGDLVFFKTDKKNAINHVGLVIDIKKGEILFIHSTIAKGVIISSMEEQYWKKAFVAVRRII